MKRTPPHHRTEEPSLFDSAPGERDREAGCPLAERMRPTSLDEFKGQDHILGPGRLLRTAIEQDRLSSLILYGPPGTGKTTLARIIAAGTQSAFFTLNAVLDGIPQIKKVIEEIQDRARFQNRRSILFVDEVHRWGKNQQDALLPRVENGTLVLIGATTANPSFEVNAALLSRSRVFRLKALGSRELDEILQAALDHPEKGCGHRKILWEPGAREHLVRSATGDARTLLNSLEWALESRAPEAGSAPRDLSPDNEIFISLKTAEESTGRQKALYDKNGEEHYNLISALIKSLRRGDPDAGLYWLARMLRGGEDPAFLFRRLLIFASEDVGMADPRALIFINAAARAFRQVGLPEGRYHLSQSILYLATAPKSDSAKAYFHALRAAETEGNPEVPEHLKNRPSGNTGSRPSDSSRSNLPPELGSRKFYRPSDQGFEAEIACRLRSPKKPPREQS